MHSAVISPESNSSRWHFVEDVDRTWHWHHENGAGPISSETFEAFGPCMADAIKHGFRPKLDKYTTRAGAGPDIDWSRQPALKLRP